jgi:hypothetical protein
MQNSLKAAAGGTYSYHSALTLEAPVVLHYLKAPAAVKLTAVCFIAF